MSKKSVVSIGIEIPGADVEKISIKSKVSLLDYEIVIINPSIFNFYGYSHDNYLGKPCLDDSNSFSLKEQLAHWRREILENIKARKNVFIMLNENEEVYVATDKESYSGTGRLLDTFV